MTCVISGCSGSVHAKVTHIGKVTWTGALCQPCVEELWEKSKAVVSAGLVGIIFERPELSATPEDSRQRALPCPNELAQWE